MLRIAIFIFLIISFPILANPFNTNEELKQNSLHNKAKDISLTEPNINPLTPTQLTVHQAFQFDLEQKNTTSL